ncbi:hypothetical protein [Amycolatopsis taiwanensis]|uniref:hypothetical protein n=1 Tax=Amycolatopsis taiwanensis TaxID=342230 RepID=UPI0004B3A87D|nr:hypothetical protein [Amycolatopsis taiwanensis]
MVVDQLWGATYYRLLVPNEPVTHDFLVALVALVGNLLDGIAQCLPRHRAFPGFPSALAPASPASERRREFVSGLRPLEQAAGAHAAIELRAVVGKTCCGPQRRRRCQRSRREQHLREAGGLSEARLS